MCGVALLRLRGIPLRVTDLTKIWPPLQDLKNSPFFHGEAGWQNEVT